MKKAILLHGFHKNAKDMKPLAKYLTELGYDCFTPNLPLTFHEFDYAASHLEDQINDLTRQMAKGEKVHLIGHSTGGLVIRKFLAITNYLDRIDRSVLIATPNKGCKLATIASNVKGYTDIFKTVRSLHVNYINQINFTHDTTIEIGAIAGYRNNLLLGKLIDDVNDGRVEIDSVYLPELKDFLLLPYGHKEIHHRRQTAHWIHRFLKRGSFHIQKQKAIVNRNNIYFSEKYN